MKILFLTNIPSPYMVNFLNELGKLCQLRVVFEKAESMERAGRWNEYSFDTFEGIILTGISMSTDTALSLGVIKYLTKDYDAIIVGNPMSPTGIVAINYMRMRGIDFIIESEGGFPKDGKGLKEALKKNTLKGAKAYFSTTELADQYFIQYGVDKDKIMHYPFTSIYDRDIVEKPLDVEGKKALRHELGLDDVINGSKDIDSAVTNSNTRVAISVGQLIHRKNYDTLIEAWRNMPANWYLLIAGEGELEAELKKQVSGYGLDNITFLGFQNSEMLKKYYLASDICVFPTREDVWGLVVNEAMACGLPVISSTRCIAADALIADGDNGYLVEAEDCKALAASIKSILNDECEIERMGMRSIEKIREYTFENMARVHFSNICGLIK